MFRFLIIMTAILSSGCVGVVGLNYHAISDSSNYIDCGDYLGEPRAGKIWKISGSGNFVEINANGNDILVCSKGMYKESQYLVGPLVPIIPMFGLGSSTLPDNIEFFLVNRSQEKGVIFKSVGEVEWCTYSFTKSNECSNFKKTNLDIEVSPGTVLSLKMVFRDEFKFIIQLENEKIIEIIFKDEKGMFFLLAV